MKLSPAARSAEFVLSRFPISLGRGSTVQVQVPDPSVSRLHCTLALVDGELVVTDQISSNGTLVNGIPLRKAVLLSGNLLSIGKVTFLVSYRPSWSRRLWRAWRRLAERAPKAVSEA